MCILHELTPGLLLGNLHGLTPGILLGNLRTISPVHAQRGRPPQGRAKSLREATR